jgi:hypothetical protein
MTYGRTGIHNKTQDLRGKDVELLLAQISHLFMLSVNYIKGVQIEYRYNHVFPGRKVSIISPVGIAFRFAWMVEYP